MKRICRSLVRRDNKRHDCQRHGKADKEGKDSEGQEEEEDALQHLETTTTTTTTTTQRQSTKSEKTIFNTVESQQDTMENNAVSNTQTQTYLGKLPHSNVVLQSKDAIPPHNYHTFFDGLACKPEGKKANRHHVHITTRE